MVDKLSGRLLLILISVMTHASVLADFWWRNDGRDFSSSWPGSFAFFVGVMMVASIISSFARSAKWLALLLSFRFVISAVLAVPSYWDPVHFNFIFALLILEAFLFLEKKYALLLFTFCLLYPLWLFRLNITLWNEAPPSIQWSSLPIVWTTLSIAAFAGFLLSNNERLRRVEQNKLKELLESNQFLVNSNINLQNVATAARVDALTHERKRIAREIHDTVAYTLTNLLSLLDAHRESLLAASSTVPARINQARNIIRDGLGEIRSVLQGLRTVERDDDQGLGKIERLIEVFKQATGIKIMLRLGDIPRLFDKELEDVLYRIVQEGLTNAFRHGHASVVWVALRREKNGIELSVRDNGYGSAVMTGGFGLMGINERVRAMGGTVTILSQPGFGFTIRVYLPQQLRKNGV